ncbi:hypothetical protein IC582_000412 [Cucumis melo]
MLFDCSSLMNQNLLINCFRFRVLMSGSAVMSVFCCVGSLAIMGSLQHIDKDLLGLWLCERQIKSGGPRGRPEKLPECGFELLLHTLTNSWLGSYSYSPTHQLHCVASVLLLTDTENGGISDRSDGAVDVYHTYHTCLNRIFLSKKIVSSNAID